MVYYLIEELVAMGHEVTLFGTADSQTSANLVPIWPTSHSQDREYSYFDLSVYATWAVAEAFARADQFDIIHDHTWYNAGHFARCVRDKTPIVSTAHHPFDKSIAFAQSLPAEYQQYMRNRIRTQFDAVSAVVVSEFQAKMLAASWNVRAHTIHNGIPLDSWKDWSQEQGDYIAFLGYISGNKGVAEAIQAVLPTNERLIIAGALKQHDEASHLYFINHVEPFIDNDQIQYHGPQDHTQKQVFLKQAKATLMPIQWDEPFGMVAIESMACGTPVIGWNRGALPEIIVDGITGYIVNSVEEMTEKIGMIDRIDRQACRKHVEDNFNVHKMAKEYEKLYVSLVR